MSASFRRFRSSRPWQRVRAEVLASSNVCGICGHRIDMSLSGSHPDGPTVDHIRPLIMGGALLERSNLRPAHRRCNLSRGSRDDTPRTSRDW